LINWNGGEFTLPCIASLKRGLLLPEWIVVVDNASQDESPNEIGRQYPDVVLIRNEVNKGFAEGNNIGVRRALELGAEYVWLLNNDTVVAKDCLLRLIAATKTEPEAACYTTKIYYENPDTMLWYDGGEWHPLHLAPRHCHQQEYDCDPDSDDVVPTEFVSGCSMLIPAQVVREYGLFCRKFVAYSEDADFCLRLKKARRMLCYVKGAKIWHKVSASLKKNLASSDPAHAPGIALYLMVRNNYWMFRRNLNSILLLPVLLLHLCIAVKISLNFILSGNSAGVKCVARAVKDGLFADLTDMTFSATVVIGSKQGSS